MDFQAFQKSLDQEIPPQNLAHPLQALWQDAKGDWHLAHKIAKEIHDENGAWIHAYLHRKEGDESNAAYWYSRAKRKRPNVALKQEWEDIVRNLLCQK